ncbi:MAG: hypothetical protein GF401_02205 [Chitinivibrionales bacterium]|nr:hypothetical protein [Chitinivibrionales bacterium]
MIFRFFNVVFVCLIIMGFAATASFGDDDLLLVDQDGESDIIVEPSGQVDRAKNNEKRDEKNDGSGENEDTDKSYFAPVNDISRKGFAHKLFFSETPEIGHPWRGGIRTNITSVKLIEERDDGATMDTAVLPLPIFDFYFTFAQIMTIDILYAGIPIFETGSMTLGDNFSLITLKSCPYTVPFNGHAYKAGGGLKLYGAKSQITDHLGDGFPLEEDRALGLFATQGLTFNNRHRINLYSSLNFRNQGSASGNTRLITTYYLAPAYRIYWGKKLDWSFRFEYYMMNPVDLPLRLFQILGSEDNLDFYNPDRLMFSLLFWGFSYNTRHLRIDLTLINHISFADRPYLMLGFGWDF